MEIKQIIKGVFNHLFLSSRPLWKERAEVCSVCPLNINGMCFRNLWIDNKYIDNPQLYNRIFNTEGIVRIMGIVPENGTCKVEEITYVRGCGCVLKFKQKSGSRCPAGFW
jgi:hypothetical protein